MTPLTRKSTSAFAFVLLFFLAAGAVDADQHSKIAFVSIRDGNDEIYVMNANGSDVTRLTNDPASDGGPAWSPDGLKIAFSSNRDGSYEIYIMNTDGSNVTRLTNYPESDTMPAWGP